MNASDMLSLFSPAVRSMPKFMALAEAVLRQVADLQLVVSEIPRTFSLNEACGVQLDLIGGNIGIPRKDVPGGTTDSVYRDYLRSKLALWRWNGMNEGVPSTLAQCFPDGRVSISDNGNGSINVVVTGTTPSNLDDKIPAPAGVSRIVMN